MKASNVNKFENNDRRLKANKMSLKFKPFSNLHIAWY